MTKLLKALLSLGLILSLAGCSTSKKDTSATNDNTEETETNDDTSKEDTSDDDSTDEEKEESTEKKTTTKKSSSTTKTTTTEDTSTTTKKEVVTINVESDSIVGGKWITAISNTTAKTPGSNQSPGIMFDAVDGATSYCIYMIDTSASNWMHWKATGLTEVVYNLGANVGTYKGPYPPSGTHTYVVHVFALAATPDSYPGNMDAKNSSISTIQSKLDKSGGNSGNVLGHGQISATVTSGGEVVQ